MEKDPKLYEKIFDIFLALRDARERFKTYSAPDINKLIAAKLNAKSQKEPAPLQELYNLEKTISYEKRGTLKASIFKLSNNNDGNFCFNCPCHFPDK